MAGVLRTPRPVPAVNMQAVKAVQAVTINDEVAAILKGLKLDKSFFMERLRPESLSMLAPEAPKAGEGDDKGNDKKLIKRESIRKRRSTMQRAAAVASTSDFDIYLNEAVMPILAQALDALCRQLARMNEQGDHLDPKVRARFNPLTWLGQQLLRRHPKCSRTPRRATIYRSFRDWADWEKGRRELLRRRNEVEVVFNGFMLRGCVKHETIPAVLAALDDSMCLEGAIKNSVEIEAAAKGDFSLLSDPTLSARRNTGRNREGIQFEEFWYRLGTVVMRQEIVPYSLLLRGDQQRARDAAEAADWQKKHEAAEAEREAEEAEKRRQTQEYAALHEHLVADEGIQSILNGKILTGDDVREGDVGFELEAKPHGSHVDLLGKFLVLLGFEDAATVDEESDAAPSPVSATTGTAVTSSMGTGLLRASKAGKEKQKGGEATAVDGVGRYWDDALSKAWMVVQKVHHADLADGVVDGELLKQVLVPPVGFNMLKAKIEYELERRQEADDDDDDEKPRIQLSEDAKPTKEQLCIRLGMTMSRLDWLHKLFESYLLPDESDPDAPPPCCMYPECPASLNKEQMRTLVSEVEPGLTKAQFDARFTRIDKDGSGLIEFDEFAMWVHSSDIRISGNAACKMTFEEIANRYQEPLDLIMYLYAQFVDALPEGMEDNYPIDPTGCPKEDAIFLAESLIPNLNVQEFKENFEFVDGHSRQKGHCDFDEFVELLDLDDLPAELRDRYEEN